MARFEENNPSDSKLEGPKPGQIWDQQQKLTDDITVLMDELDRLENRLRPVFKYKDGGEVNGDDETSSEMSPMASFIDSERNRIRLIIERVRSMTDRVDL